MNWRDGPDANSFTYHVDACAVRRGRKPASESRAAEVRTRLAAWRQIPEAHRVSLRALAVQIGTSHQLLSFYLQRLDRWHACGGRQLSPYSMRRSAGGLLREGSFPIHDTLRARISVLCVRESLDRFPSLINTILKQRIYQMVLHRPIECSALSRISASFGPSSVSERRNSLLGPARGRRR
jgi:hypothetical protein